MQTSQAGKFSLVVALAVLILSGCGSPQPPARSASKEISDAETAMANARSWETRGQLAPALDEYKKVVDACTQGRAFASGTELTRLSTLNDEARQRRVELENKLLVSQASAERPKVAVTPTVDLEDEKKKADEAARKKRETDAAAASKAVAAVSMDKPAPKKADEGTDEIPAPPPPKPKPAAPSPGVSKPLSNKPIFGNRAAPDEKEVEVEAGAPPSARVLGKDGIYSSFNDTCPPVEVLKVAVKGHFVVGYFQLYNKSDQGKRIMSVTVSFKDRDNQQLIEPRTVAVFPFERFTLDKKDPFEQQVEAVTSGSNQITGMDGLNLVALGESPKAANVKRISVKVIYNDNTSEYGDGPSGPAAPGQLFR